MATSQIATNLSSIRTHNVFARNNTSMDAALQRVSTGLKINSAKDNASQYAISERMLERLNANQQASQNVQTDQAVANTASSGIGTIVDILKQLRSRAIDAANDSNSDADRQTIQKDVQNLLAQIDSSAQSVKYNGKSLLNGTYDETVMCSTSHVVALDMNASESGKTLTDLLGLTTGQTARIVTTWAGADGAVTVDKSTATAVAGTTALSTILTLGSSYTTFSGTGATATAGSNINGVKDKNGQDVKSTVTGFSVYSDSKFSGLTVKIISNADDSKSVTYSFNSLIQEAKAENTSANPLTFQVGDSTGMTTNLAIGDLSTKGLGITNINVGDREKAEGTINVIDSAITQALNQQTNVGAMEKRLGYTADSLDTISENLQASNSAIRDSDMAKEISAYMKWSTLSQASQYMLAQSNQNAFQVLNLLQ